MLQHGVTNRTKSHSQPASAGFLLPALATDEARGYNTSIRFRLRILLTVCALELWLIFAFGFTGVCSTLGVLAVR
jgi:hypothetical protein